MCFWANIWGLVLPSIIKFDICGVKMVTWIFEEFWHFLQLVGRVTYRIFSFRKHIARLPLPDHLGSDPVQFVSFLIPLKTSSSFKWPVRDLKHNHIKNRYPLIIKRFSLTGRCLIWYKWYRLNLWIISIPVTDIGLLKKGGGGQS